MGLGNEGVIIVTAETMINGVKEIEDLQIRADALMKRMLEDVRSLSAYWESDAASAYINKFNMMEDDMERFSRKLKGYADDLYEIRRQYLEAEENNLVHVDTLGGDVLQ